MPLDLNLAHFLLLGQLLGQCGALRVEVQVGGLADLDVRVDIVTAFGLG